ncbi:nitrate reductase [Pannonibacter sp.]|uniref:nitrate reductase n=1 Tax=Pannonibacter sp. TaxID=1906786 RepID=UPI003F7122CA
MAETVTRTTCPYCGVGCGVLASRQADGTVRVAGDPSHPANFGRLCSKGSALAETLSLDGRLLHPEIGGRRASWDMALGVVARRFAETVAEYGPDSIALYGSGQLLTEDYYVANKLMKGFIGTANIDTNSRLCMASSVAGHRRGFGSDTVPGCYEDLELAELVVLVGSNLAWCHPVLFQRLEAVRAERPGLRIVTIDPRRTATSEIADLHLGLRPDGDVALFAGLLRYLAEAGRLDEAYLARHTGGAEAALAAASACDIATVAAASGLAAADVGRFYELFTRTDKVVTVYSQGVNQSVCGTDKVNAILNVHLATGRIGKPGMGPFSVTGQPNAMGGREVGGMANMLAAHMDLDNPVHRVIVQSIWGAPRLAARPGLKAVDLFEAIHAGRIKAVWIMGTNPVDSLPDADRVAEALSRCPFVVVSDVIRATDTAPYAHVLLPAAAWGEKDGTVTNSERRISRQRAFLPLPGEARPDWAILSAVARRMGHSAGFAYDGPAAIFSEHARLSGTGNQGSRDFDISAHAGISAEAYDALDPFLWPQPAGTTGVAGQGGRQFANGGFFTPDGRARLVAVTPPVPAAATSDCLILNTGRIRDQWHTMTRTGRTGRLFAHIAEPFAEIHPGDARALGIEAADLVVLDNAQGEAVLRAVVTDRVRPGEVFAPMHWTSLFSARSRIDVLVSAATDPYSGQPGLKRSTVGLRRLEASWYGFAVLAGVPAHLPFAYWAIAPLGTGRRDDGQRLEFAAIDDAEPEALAAEVLQRCGHGTESLSFQSRGDGLYRAMAFLDGRLVGAVFLARQPVAVSRSWACGLLGLSAPTPGTRWKLLAGRPAADQPDKGAIVCSCFQVGANEIRGAVAAGITTVSGIGASLSAGSNCGSCRSEIARLIADIVEQQEEASHVARSA